MDSMDDSRLKELAAEAWARAEKEEASFVEADNAEHEGRVAEMIRRAEQALTRCQEKQNQELGFVPATDDDFAAAGWTRNVTGSSSGESDSETGDVFGIARKLRNSSFFVNHGRSLEDNFQRRGFEGYGLYSGQDWRARVAKATHGCFVRVPTLKGRELDALWVEAWHDTHSRSSGAVAVIFHANAMVCLDMASWAKWYAQRGISALCVTMGGYAESDPMPGGSTTEMSTYFDAQAAVDWVRRRYSNHRILVHGLSIGGGLAIAAAKANPGVHCTADQTFVNSEEVGLICAQEVSTRLPKWLVLQTVKAMFKKDLVDPNLPGYTTDGYNNEKKVSHVKGQLFVFWASEDDMMPPDFALRLFNARYQPSEEAEVPGGADGFYQVRVMELADGEGPGQRCVAQEPLYSRMRETRLACIEGWHCTFFGYDIRAVKVYEAYLRSIFDLGPRDLDIRTWVSREPSVLANVGLKHDLILFQSMSSDFLQKD